MIGQLVGHYRVLERIGAGGMGEVFRARDERLGRDVALKLIRPSSSENADHLRRFEQEARAAAALNHPNILAIFDVGFAGSTPYIVSELLEGRTLRQRLSEGTISVRQSADYALQIAQGLIAAHERHIVHRDLKPENLFLTHDGRIKILDFGVAKLQISSPDQGAMADLPTVTKSGAVVGTVAYMAPEQLRGKPVDHRSDIFSFGAILYEMLSGQRAFRGETEVDTMTAVLREEPSESTLEEAEIPSGYRDVVRHCLEKEPDNRFQSSKDLAFALQTLSGSSPGTGASLPKPRLRSGRVVPWVVAALLGAAALLLLARQLSPTPSAKYDRLTFQAGTVYAARFVPNTPSVIYSAGWNGNGVQLYSTVANSVLSQSLNLGEANLLAVSRSNELALVLHGTHSGQLETIDGMLARSPLAGGSPREVLADVRWADWSPSGELAVVHYLDGYSRLEYPIGNVLYQSKGWISNIRISPKGDLIAFMDHPALWDDRGSLSLSDLNGHVRALCGEWESENGIAWRPDGKEIWFSAVEKGNNLNLMGVDLKGKVRTLLDLPVGLVLQDIAADGRVLMTLNTTRLAMGFAEVGSREDSDLSWHDWNVARDISPDGQSVLFGDASEAAGSGYAVAWRRLDGMLPVRIGDGSAGGLSPDGKWAISISATKPNQVTLLPVHAGQPRSVPVNGLEHIQGGFARFLADGETIEVYGNEPGHDSRCFLLDLVGGKPKPITPEGTSCGPSSPDAKSVIGIGASSASTVYSLGGTPPRPLSLAPHFLPVQWSVDGTSLYGYRIGELPSRVYKVDIASGKETVIRELRPVVPAGVVSVAPVVVSRDGTHLAYSYNQTLSVLYLVSGLH